MGKINWRISEPDGEFLTRSTVQKFVQTAPGVLENHDNEYLHYQDDWFILDHGNEDDPDMGWVLIYYRGRNDAWAGYGGGTLYTRSPKVSQQILERVSEACERANVPFDKFWKTTDNSCPEVTDPLALRRAYLEKLVQEGEITAAQQLTYLAKSAYSEVDKDERYVIEGARRIEQMTEEFVRAEARLLEKAEKELEKDVVADLVAVEKEIEKDEQLIEVPFRQFFNNLFSIFK